MRRIGIVLSVLSISVAGCASDGGMSEGTRRGVATGALVGLTMGALTGDAGYAAAGAAAGAVAGGAAGSWADYTQDRQDYRAETLAGAIASKDAGGQGEAPAGWDDINAFIGSWRVTMWSLDSNGNRVDGEASATSSLNTTQSVTFQFKAVPAVVAKVSEFVADMIWLAFNLYFVYLSYDFIFNRMNAFWKSQTLGIPMKYIYLVLPIAFALMSIRIIQVNYLKLVKGVDIRDPDSQEMEAIEEHMADPNANKQS